MTDDLMRHFVCPECGSEEWGTSGLLGPFSEWKGHCHGQGCTYTWLRGDDAKCFLIIDENEEEGEC